MRAQDTSAGPLRLRGQGAYHAYHAPLSQAFTLSHMLLILQLYAGSLYIHSNLTDRLGNAAPSPRLFLLQVLRLHNL